MKQNIDLLYVEDNEDYIDFVKRAVNKIDEKLIYHYVSDGKDAIDYFEKNSNKKSCAKLILLDINLPGISGIELLKKIRSYPQLKYVPVIMFSSSDNSDDVKRSYDNGANAYLIKPSGMSSLTQALKSVCEFWLSLNYNYN